MPESQLSIFENRVPIRFKTCVHSSFIAPAAQPPAQGVAGAKRHHRPLAAEMSHRDVYTYTRIYVWLYMYDRYTQTLCTVYRMSTYWKSFGLVICFLWGFYPWSECAEYTRRGPTGPTWKVKETRGPSFLHRKHLKTGCEQSPNPWWLMVGGGVKSQGSLLSVCCSCCCTRLFVCWHTKVNYRLKALLNRDVAHMYTGTTDVVRGCWFLTPPLRLMLFQTSLCWNLTTNMLNRNDIMLFLCWVSQPVHFTKLRYWQKTVV